MLEEESMEGGGGGGGGNCDNPSSSSSSPPDILNEDSLIQILLWLPAISLLRFKSVCKSWRAVIENPFFIHTHAIFPPKDTTTTTTTNKLVTPIFLRYSYCDHIGNLFTVSGDNEFDVFENLGAPPYYTDSEYKYTNMVGCCNGIICLHDTDRDIYSTISLWNPAIKQCRSFQLALESNPKYVLEHFVGFGYDVKTKDYKVLRITYETKIYEPKYIDDEQIIDYEQEERNYTYARGVQVYSLSTDSWRCIDATSFSNAQPYLFMHRYDMNQGHYLNGSYLFTAGYWYEDEFQEATISRRKCFKNVIMSFDFTEEIFRTIQLPFDAKYRFGDDAYIILFGEKIAFTNACYTGISNRQCIDIWVLNEYGGNESWSKFYTFVSKIRPTFITDSGEFILLDGGRDVSKLELLNIVTEEIKDLQCDCDGPSRNIGMIITRVGVYKPTLVPIARNGATDNIIRG